MAAPGKRTKNFGGPRIGETGKFEGEFKVAKNPAFLKNRLEVWDKLWKVQQKATEERSKKERKPIEIILPDGTKKSGFSWETTPMDIANGISKNLAKDVVCAKVTYTEAVNSLTELQGGDVMDYSDDEEEEEKADEGIQAVLWDATRPLEGSCHIALLKFDHPEGTETFWHSSAHILGQALEQEYGGYLTIGPPLESGFYYDIFVGGEKLTQDKYEHIDKVIENITKADQPFERLVLTKTEALELFGDNPFKVQLITNKVPDGAKTSAYRCGPLIDLCRGPHLPSTSRVKSMMCTKSSSAYWLGKSELDSLQRVYGIAFPDDKRLKEYKKMLEEAKERDHRTLGTKQELFFFHATTSPGSCFWQPRGTIIYNALIEFMRREYRIRGFQEVITPNIYADRLFQQSGHWQAYYDGMYRFDVEGQEWFLKPMNCPGHCMVFDHRIRSYKELPIRMASFGVLHRNELSGTLSGLTRVRRFQQDDAHIFCRPDQIKDEVRGALEFLFYVYKVFGFEFTVALSTRPKKAIGERWLWDKSEQILRECLDGMGKEWSLNPGDGAFYGPKIDIRLTDALRRKHQCGTIQLDFQQPIRFNLQYRKEGADDEAEAKEEVKEPEPEEPKPADGKKAEYVWKEGKLKQGYERPVMIHRAILGSVERMMAILSEHYGGKWPFWLSPRQIIVIPISEKFLEYAEYVHKTLTNFLFHADVDPSGATLNKKIRTAQLAQYNYMAIVGENEEQNLTVALRGRESKGDIGSFTLQDLVARLQSEAAPSSRELKTFEAYKGRMPEAPGAGAAAAAAPKAGAPKAAAGKGGAKAGAKAAAGGAGAKGRPGADGLEGVLADTPYVQGFTPTKADRERFESLAGVAPATPNLKRWYEHIESFSTTERALWA